MTIREQISNLIKTKYNGVEFTSNDIIKHFQPINKKSINSVLCDMGNKGYVKIVGKKKIDDRYEFKIYLYGDRIENRVETIPEWGKAWPHVYAGLTQKRKRSCSVYTARQG